MTLRRGDPALVVAELAAAGAALVHVVDLDGARSGELAPALFARLAEAAAPARIQASGGVRSVADAEALLEAGAARVLVGTAALTEPGPAAFADALGDRLVVALDVRDGTVVVRGWTASAGERAEAAAERCAAAGVARLHCTAVERDGTLAGPDTELLRRVVDASGLPVVAAGGIATEAHLAAVAAAGCEAAVVGRALLDGTLPLAVLRPSSDDGGRPEYAPSMARTDGTRRTSLAELRERVAELERERELLNAIANTAPSLLCLIDPDGTVRPYATNRAFERRLDYEPGETSGVRFWERHVPTEDAADVRAAIEAVVAGGEPTFHEGRWLTQAGEVVHVRVVVRPAADDRERAALPPVRLGRDRAQAARGRGASAPARGSSPRPTRRGSGSSGTSTTAPSSGSSPCCSRSGSRARAGTRARRRGRRSTRRSPSSGPRSTSCGSSRAGSTRRR